MIKAGLFSLKLGRGSDGVHSVQRSSTGCPLSGDSETALETLSGKPGMVEKPKPTLSKGTRTDSQQLPQTDLVLFQKLS